MSSPAVVSAAAVTLRRLLVKHPWIYWAVVGLAALGAGASMLERSDRVDDRRAAWGETRSVWVATADLAPGDPVSAERRDLPRAMVPDGATSDVDGLTARQHVAVGEIVHTVDVVAPSGPQALTPRGWVAVPVNESPVSGAAVGDRVRVAGDGVVLSTDAIVVGHHDGSSLVAVPTDEAAAIAALADHVGVTLLLVP
ncbi:MAG: hypothetical protein R8G01_08190 [Ilumatobacteraceae bacterium]|nr:hypothetical protein [Ilumatobacteraceae bacterium]